MNSAPAISPAPPPAPPPARSLALAALALAALGLAAVRVRRLTVEGPSMEPALLRGDRLVVVAGPLGRRRLRPGAIVALHRPGPGGRSPGARLLVKRVVAVTADGVVVEGDNRRHSTDSRDFGPVPRRAVVGRAVYRYFPPARAGRLT